MSDIAGFFFPDQLHLAASLTLIVTSFFTSALTAAVGLGGGSR